MQTVQMEDLGNPYGESEYSTRRIVVLVSYHRFVSCNLMLIIVMPLRISSSVLMHLFVSPLSHQQYHYPVPYAYMPTSDPILIPVDFAQTSLFLL